MRRVFNWVGGVFGVGAGIVIWAICLFSVPLSVIAQMRLFGWSWWQALLGSTLIIAVPLLGQIAFLVFAVIGAYYLAIAQFDVSAAVAPPIQTVDITTVSPEKFGEWKTKFLKPNFNEQCKQELLKQMGVDGKLPTIAATYCECVAQIVSSEITQDDLTPSGQVKLNSAPPRYAGRIKSECYRKK